jgi:hypothetical protein
VKTYGQTTEGQKRYSPPECVGAKRVPVMGNPDPKHISTSYAERQNLSMRMGMRRFTRLTNAFSKKVENDAHAISIYFMHYNLVRIHTTLRVTPAMAAGVSKTLWTMEDVVRIVDEWEMSQKVALRVARFDSGLRISYPSAATCEGRLLWPRYRRITRASPKDPRRDTTTIMIAGTASGSSRNTKGLAPRIDHSAKECQKLG